MFSSSGELFIETAIFNLDAPSVIHQGCILVENINQKALGYDLITKRIL